MLLNLVLGLWVGWDAPPVHLWATAGMFQPAGKAAAVTGAGSEPPPLKVEWEVSWKRLNNDCKLTR